MIRTFSRGPDGTLRPHVEGADPGGLTWIDVQDPSQADLLTLGRQHQLERLDLEDVLEDTELPKHRSSANFHFVILHSVAALSDDRISTSELDSFIGSNILITFHRGDLEGLEWLIQEATRFPAAAEGGPDRMFARLVAVTARRFFPVIDELEQRNLDLEEPAAAGHPFVPEVAQVLRRETVILRRALGPQAEVVAQVARSESPLFDESARARLSDTADEFRRLVEAIDSERTLLAGVVETYRGAVAERMNEAMRVLTVFSAILLPLAVMAGIYGMNFDNMPELAWQWGYFGALAVMAVTALSLWTYFARRGFIGAPRLGKIPSTLVKGVAAGVKGVAVVTTAPFRLLLDELGGSTPGSQKGDTMDQQGGDEE